jgi:hypothetical protein
VGVMLLVPFKLFSEFAKFFFENVRADARGVHVPHLVEGL